METWSSSDLERFGGVNELAIATQRKDGTRRAFLPIWVVRVDDDLFVRSWHGRSGSWFRQALSSRTLHVRAGEAERVVTVEEADPDLRGAIDQAFRAKYGSGWHVDAMVGLDAAEASLRLVP